MSLLLWKGLLRDQRRTTKLGMGNVVRTAARTAGNPGLSWGPHWKEAQELLANVEGAYQNIA